jgi:hypothetical protein
MLLELNAASQTFNISPIHASEQLSCGHPHWGTSSIEAHY